MFHFPGGGTIAFALLKRSCILEWPLLPWVVAFSKDLSVTESPAPPAADAATCPRHPGAPVVGACARCGTFICAQDAVALGPKSFCASCAVRPDVDYLEAFRLKYWGKRDGWAWAFGAGGVFNAIASVALAVTFVTELPKGPKTSLPFAALSLMTGLAAANGVLFWLGKAWSRWGILVVAAGLTLIEVSEAGPAGLLVMVIPTIIAVNIFVNWRTRLFFKLPVQRATLQRAWDLLHNNSIARQSLVAAIAGLAIPGFSLVALIMAYIGLRNVDPSAYPPIGKKGYAIAGLALGGFGVLEWLGILLAFGWPR